jgi:hypothetical protein
VSTTPTCKKLFDVNAYNRQIVADYNVWIYEWSDDFEPNSSLTKSNRGGVWVKTMTFGPPDTHRHLMAYTYPVAIGPKNKSHEEVEIILRDDLLKMSSPAGIPIYSKVHGGIICIRAKMLASLQDQPERRGENFLTAGSSTYHRRFGYSFPWQDYEEVLRPCDSCRTTLFDTTKPWEYKTGCSHCTNFVYDLNHPLLIHNPDLVGLGPLGPMKLD